MMTGRSVELQVLEGLTKAQLPCLVATSRGINSPRAVSYSVRAVKEWLSFFSLGLYLGIFASGALWRVAVVSGSLFTKGVSIV